MKKIVVSVLLLSFSFITMTAQSNEATLIFKDGSKISGLGKLTNAKTIKFRKTKKLGPILAIANATHCNCCSVALNYRVSHRSQGHLLQN